MLHWLKLTSPRAAIPGYLLRSQSVQDYPVQLPMASAKPKASLPNCSGNFLSNGQGQFPSCLSVERTVPMASSAAVLHSLARTWLEPHRGSTALPNLFNSAFANKIGTCHVIFPYGPRCSQVRRRGVSRGEWRSAINRRIPSANCRFVTGPLRVCKIVEARLDGMYASRYMAPGTIRNARRP